MHFWVSAARLSRAGRTPAHVETLGFLSPRKMGTNWFMPALVKSSPGESGSREEEGTTVCCCWWKKSRKDWRISAEVMAAESSEWRGVSSEEKDGGGECCETVARSARR